MYSRATVTFRGAGKTRRWRSAIAIVAALSLFGAVTTGWAARGSVFATAALPQPAALSHGTPTAGVDFGYLQPDDHSQPTSLFARSATSGNSTHQKPTKNTWMTRDRPSTWTPLWPQTVRSRLTASFAMSGCPPGTARVVAPPSAPADRDILTQLCVARR